MNDFEDLINKLSIKIKDDKTDNIKEKEDEYKKQLDKLLDGTDLASKQDPNFFYNLIQDYKTESKRLIDYLFV